MRVFFSAGEASGDAYGAEILRRLQPSPPGPIARLFTEWAHENKVRSVEEARRLLREDRSKISQLGAVDLVAGFEKEFGIQVPPGAEPTGSPFDFIEERLSLLASNASVAAAAVGGRRLAEAGARIVADSSDWGAVGIVEAARVSPRVIAGSIRAKRELRRGRPGLFVPIDFGYVNVKLARYAKSKGWKVLYFVPPGSWRRTKQGADLPEVTDAIVTPFPWSAEMLNKAGATAYDFGHPLKEMVARTPDVAVRGGVAVLPGSRRHEIEQNVPVIATAIKSFEGPVRIALAPSANARLVRSAWTKWSDHEPIFYDGAPAALKASRSAVVCSGTATLEAALCACPCVVVYRGGWAMELEYRLRRPKFEHVSLPNILLGRPLLKELIQRDATAEAVKLELQALHEDGPRRREVLSGFEETSACLGGSDCLERTADLIRSMAAD